MVNPLILKYRLKLLARQGVCPLLACRPQRRLASPPAVTLFISSLNTRYPLALTLESLVRCTRYPNYRIVIGENGSTDGSREYLEKIRGTLPIELICVPQPRMHKDWLNDMFHTATTPYWFAVDSDMLFMGRDWLWDMVQVMEANPDLYLLAAEQLKPAFGQVEPVAGETIDAGERPSTWLFGVRASLRERMDSDFAFHKVGINPDTGRLFVYDVGGKFLHDMRANNLRYAYMPGWFQCKYFHFESLSWSLADKPQTDYQRMKQYQMQDIRHRVQNSNSLHYHAN